jgi:hypothetical protein
LSNIYLSQNIIPVLELYGQIVLSEIFWVSKHFRENVDFNLHRVFQFKNAGNKVYFIRVEKPARNP